MFNRQNFKGSRFFQDYREEINRENKIQLTRISLLGIIICGGLFLISYFEQSFEAEHLPYFLLMISFILIHVIAKKGKNYYLILTDFYLFFAVCYAFGIYAALFSSLTHSLVTFCVGLTVLSMFLMDKSVRVYTFNIMAAAIFLICGATYGRAEFGAAQVTDCLAYLIIGMAIYHSNIGLRMKDIRGKRVLTQKAEFDPLTGLFNRSALEQNVTKFLQKMDGQAAFILIDVDNFKSINDHFGHAYGDELLRQTAMILKNQFRNSDYIGRLGGDEFVVFIPNPISQEMLLHRIQLLVEEMNQTYIDDQAICSISGSIGIAIFPENGSDFDELYQNADKAMYESKKAGKGMFTVYKEN